MNTAEALTRHLKSASGLGTEYIGVLQESDIEMSRLGKLIPCLLVQWAGGAAKRSGNEVPDQVDVYACSFNRAYNHADAAHQSTALARRTAQWLVDHPYWETGEPEQKCFQIVVPQSGLSYGPWRSNDPQFSVTLMRVRVRQWGDRRPVG